VVNSPDLRRSLEDADRRECWVRSGFASLLFAPRYLQEETAEERKEMEKALRDRYVPPCEGDAT
jgi:hypothetical protein